MTQQENPVPGKKTVTITIYRDWGQVKVTASVDEVDGKPELFETSVEHHAAQCGPYKKDRWSLQDVVARFPGNVSDLSVTFTHKTHEISRTLPDGGLCRLTIRTFGHYGKLPNAAHEAFIGKIRTFERNAPEDVKREWATKIFDDLSRGDEFPQEMLVGIVYIPPPSFVPAPAPVRAARSTT